MIAGAVAVMWLRQDRPGNDACRFALIDDVPMLTFEHEDDGRWRMNGTEISPLRGALDFDLGISPATNTLAIRRLGLAVGQSAKTLAAWLDPSDWMLKPLKQRYARVSGTGYDYASDTGFAGRLTVDEHGIVRDYPGWWVAQA